MSEDLSLDSPSADWFLRILFPYFKSDTICLTAKVCKFWRNFSLDNYPWTLACVFTVGVKYNIPPFNEKPISRKLQKVLVERNFIRLYFEQHDFEYADIEYDGDFSHVNLLSLFTQNSECKRWKASVEILKKEIPPSRYISISRDPCYTATITFHVNLHELGNAVENKNKIEIDAIQEAFKFSSFIFEMHTSNAEKLGVLKPLESFPLIPQPAGFKEKVKLFKYQLDAISWQVSKEKNPPTFHEDTATMFAWRSRKFNLCFDIKSQAFVEFPFKPSSAVITSKGAILADAMGLGKTVTTIGLILANPPPPFSIDDIKQIVPEEKKTTKKTKAKKDESEETPEDYKKVFLEFLNPDKKKKKKKAAIPRDSSEYADKDLSHLLYPTRASLVACPSHLVKQWQEEVEKFTDPPLKVVAIAVLADIKVVKYRDIIEADVVIVSYQFLQNSTYFHIGHITPGPSIRAKEEQRRHNWVKRYLEELRQEKNAGIDNVAPVLDHFAYNRIILDEGHEALSKLFFLETFQGYKPKFYWVLSGTPFAGLGIARNYAQLFDLNLQTSGYHFIGNFIAQNLIWRNTKASIADEYPKEKEKENLILDLKVLRDETPSIVEEIKFLEFTPLEKLVYNKEPDLAKCCFMGPYSLAWHRNWHAGDQKGNIVLFLNRVEQYGRELQNLDKKEAAISEELKEEENWQLKRELDMTSVKITRTRGEATRNAQAAFSAARLYNAFKQTKPDNVASFSVSLLFDSISDTAVVEIINKVNDLEDLSGSFIEELPKSLTAETNGEESYEEKKDDAAEQAKPKTTAKKGTKRQARGGKRGRAKKARVDSDPEPEPEEENKTEVTSNIEPEKEIPEPELEPEAKIETLPEPKMEIEAQPKTETETIPESKVEATENSNINVESSKEPSADTKPEIIEEPKTPEIPLEGANAQPNNEDVLQFLVETYGTKIGNLLFYLRNLWTNDPTARILIFSKDHSFLQFIGSALQACGISSGMVTGNVLKRTKAISGFKSEDIKIRVLLLSFHVSASGTNLIEASHVFLMDPACAKPPSSRPRYYNNNNWGNYITVANTKALESQAIGRAHRQGQRKNVTVVRYMIKESLEHMLYNKAYDIKETLPDPFSRHIDPPKLKRTTSIGNMIATNPYLMYLGMLAEVMEDDE